MAVKSGAWIDAVSGAWPLTPVGALTWMVSPLTGFELNGGSENLPSAPATALTREPSGNTAVTVWPGVAPEPLTTPVWASKLSTKGD